MRKREWFPLLLLGDALTVFLLLAGGLTAYLSAYDIEVNLWVLLGSCAAFSCLGAGLWSVPKGGRVALGLLVAGSLAVWRLWEHLGPAFLYLDAVTTNRLSGQGASLSSISLPGEIQSSGEALLLPALLLLAAALGIILGWVVVWARAWYLAAMTVTIPIFPAILAGILPDWLALMACIAGWGSMLLSALYDFRDKKRLGRGVLLNLAGMCALLAILTAALPREGYERPQWATDARNSLLTAVSEGVGSVLEWDLGGLAGDLNLPGTGLSPYRELADGTEDLLNVGPRSYSGRTVLTVRTNQPDPAGRIYLRGGSAAVYTGQSWEAADRVLYTRWLRQGQEALFPAQTFPEKLSSTMTIRHSQTGGTAAFYPYWPSTSLGIDADGLLTREDREYTIDYLPGDMEGFAGLDGDSAGAEVGYRAFVYQQYLDVPERARAALSGLDVQAVSLAGLPEGLPEQYLERVMTARWAAAALAEAAYYDPNIPAMEPGEDFVEHFLQEGRGYCVHFATAGTLLLRMRGIPARYATGYTARLDRFGRAQVADSDAHAWVEIYLDGFGWYPVEMTPGYLSADGTLSQTPSPLQSNEALPQEEPEELEEPDEMDTSKPEDEPEPAAPDTPENAEDSAGGGEEPDRETVDLSWLKYVLLAAAVAAAPVVLYRLALGLRRRSRTAPDTNRSVIDAYCRCQRLLRLGCCEADPGLEALARKAKFSQHTLSEEERTSAWARMEDIRTRTEAALPVWKYWIVRVMRPFL